MESATPPSSSTPFKAKFENKKSIVTVSSDAVTCKDEKTGEAYFAFETKRIRLLKMSGPHTVLLNWDDDSSTQVISAAMSARHARKIHDCIRSMIVQK